MYKYLKGEEEVVVVVIVVAAAAAAKVAEDPGIDDPGAAAGIDDPASVANRLMFEGHLRGLRIQIKEFIHLKIYLQ